ncbi:hypothetical protein V6N12_062649 [Hibiscus sabdariffa]|uniref:Uncharacterized protein n=1 Tax=Hibiscus sabdariffa TaxID=183260 RepID=A0ABR2F9K4_9ROSI
MFPPAGPSPLPMGSPDNSPVRELAAILVLGNGGLGKVEDGEDSMGVLLRQFLWMKLGSKGMMVTESDGGNNSGQNRKPSHY